MRKKKPPGNQAVPRVFSFLIRNGCGKAQDAPPNPFSVFFPSALSIGSAFMNTTPTYCKRSGSFVFPSHSGLRRRKGRPSAKMHWCITGESALAGRKISRAFQIVPPLPRAVWESPWGLAFHAIRNIKHCSHLFSRWELLCFPFPAGLGEMMWPPLCKNAPVHSGRGGLRRGKSLPRFPGCPAIAPGSLGKPLGFGFFMQSGI